MLKSMLKPEGGVMAGLGEAAAVYVIYQSALPNHTDIRSVDAHNTDVEASRKRAAWVAASFLGIAFLITQDLNAFMIGGAALAGIDLMVKHANAVHPATGKMSPDVSTADNVNAFPLPDYNDPDDSDLAY